MKKLSKRIRKIYENIDKKKQYNIEDAIAILKKFSSKNFIESIDVSFKLKINPKKSDQNIRGNVFLPHGSGKNKKIAVFYTGKDTKKIKSLGIKFIGMEDLSEIIKSKKEKFDIIIASLDTMKIVTPLARILGPKGLMPNIKSGTISSNIPETIKDFQNGKIFYKNDKDGIINSSIGKINFKTIKIKENFFSLLNSIKKNKPPSIKGDFFRKIHLSTTIGGSIKLNKTFINN